MRESPPPASIYRDKKDAEHWVCFYCRSFLVSLSFPLGEREVWTCSRCGRFQVVGGSKTIQAAARAADAKQPIVGKRTGDDAGAAIVLAASEARKLRSQLARESDRRARESFRKQKPALPNGLSSRTLGEIQRAYDALMEKYGRAPKIKVAATCKKSPNTVDKYWPYLRGMRS